jgi:hypothetical protein
MEGRKKRKYKLLNPPEKCRVAEMPYRHFYFLLFVKTPPIAAAFLHIFDKLAIFGQ